MSELEGAVALVTGAGNGIGAATARELVSHGARVVLVDVDERAVSDLAAELRQESTFPVRADVTDLGAMVKAVASATDQFGGIDVVVANAGIASYGSVARTDPAAVARLFEINVLGVFNTVRAALPAVTESGGYVLLVSSIGAFVALPGLAAYTASKAAVEQFANALRIETAHTGIDVGCAHMSWIDTPMVRDASADLSAFQQLLETMPGPLRASRSPEECAQVFVRGITGRHRHVYVPSWVRYVGWARPLVNSALAQRRIADIVPGVLEAMDHDTARLGRATSATVSTSHLKAGS